MFLKSLYNFVIYILYYILIDTFQVQRRLSYWRDIFNISRRRGEIVVQAKLFIPWLQDISNGNFVATSDSLEVIECQLKGTYLSITVIYVDRKRRNRIHQVVAKDSKSFINSEFEELEIYRVIISLCKILSSFSFFFFICKLFPEF